MGSRTRAMKLTPRDLASASTILALLLLLASAASAQHATESLTSEGQYTVEAAADPGYYTGQYQHQHQAQDFYSQYSEEPQATLAGDTDRTLDFFAGAVSAPMVMVAAFMSALMGSILAPMITAGMEAVSRLPVPDIEFPGSGGRPRARPSTTITKSAGWTRRWWTRSWRRWRARTTA